MMPEKNKHIIMFRRPSVWRVLQIFKQRGFKAGVLACCSLGAGKWSHAAVYESQWHIWHQFWGIRRDKWLNIPRISSWQDYDIYMVPASNYSHAETIEWFKYNECMPYDYLYWLGCAIYRVCKLFNKQFTIELNDRRKTHCFEAVHEALKSQGVEPDEPLPVYIYGDDLVRCYSLERVCSGTIGKK